MNKNILIGIIVALLLLIVGGFYYMNQNQVLTATPEPTSTNTDNAVGATTINPTTPTTETPKESPTPGKPIPTTNATVAPTDTTAVVTGTVIPQGAETSYWYEYGTTKSFGSKTKSQIVGSGFTAIPTPGYITGLTKNTTYYFQLVAENKYGRVTGGENSVTTMSFATAPVGGVPSLSTLGATAITVNSATLKGQVNPNKAATQYWFEYGVLGTLGNVTTFVSLGDGNSLVMAGATVTNLLPGTTYYYRVNAQNQFGTVNGAILTFKTAGKVAIAKPVVTTQVVGSISTTTATAIGTVNPAGELVSYWFEYSTDPTLAKATKTTAQKSAGAVSSTVSVQANLTKLNSNTTYYVRIVAQNAQDTVKGDVQSFKTK